ncbi:MAG: proline--tRNA ligase [Candidatus Omnitrophica bacterium]|nr:proline--tRNA ligase [Candidatus Omnitrophota bacterium]MDD5351867.1 proline--tRNA ligase [Candidatus Omnitrophota bacterium]MDD5550693.1 proline--tRNA ligase [Candidatus Omnitrophota bacterium]
MYWSKSFIHTLKEASEEAESTSHRLMLRAGMIKMLISGVYSYLPLGLKVLDNINKIIRQEMNALGSQELLMPSIQPIELWQMTKRDELLGEVMIRFQDRRGRKLCLGPTHEEVVTDLASRYIQSYRDLPFVLYQIQTKFRDELRPRFGLVRACEFIMKDAYSFDKDTEGLDEIYDKMYKAYENIFKRCGLDFVSIKADPGVIGGDVSHEFLVPAENGEDVVYKCNICGNYLSGNDAEIDVCPHCKKDLTKINALEVGHIFKLGTKYSDVFGLRYLDESGKERPVIMGCYGIGISRLIPAIIEQNNDADGIIWPKEVAPYDILVLPVNVTDKDIFSAAKKVYEILEKKKMKVILDDRDERAGIKFKDADLLGIPLRITIGEKFLKEKKVEIKSRKSKEVKLFNLDKIEEAVKGL